MTFDNARLFAVFGLMSLAIIAGAVIANAPETLPYLWEWKAAAASFTGIAGLLLKLTK